MGSSGAISRSLVAEKILLFEAKTAASKASCPDSMTDERPEATTEDVFSTRGVYKMHDSLLASRHTSSDLLQTGKEYPQPSIATKARCISSTVDKGNASNTNDNHPATHECENAALNCCAKMHECRCQSYDVRHISSEVLTMGRTKNLGNAVARRVLDCESRKDCCGDNHVDWNNNCDCKRGLRSCSKTSSARDSCDDEYLYCRSHFICSNSSYGCEERSSSSSGEDNDDDYGSDGGDDLYFIFNSVGCSRKALCESGSEEREFSEDIKYSRMKRFRSNEGLAVTPPKPLEVHCVESNGFSGTSTIYSGASAMYGLSPLIGEEAGYGYDYNQRANTQESSNSCGNQMMEQKKTLTGRLATADTSNPYKILRIPKEYLPFQLHPSHNGDTEEYHSLMRHKELYSHPSYCLRGQPKIKHSMRKILIEWLIKISHYYKMDGASLHLAVNVLDRYTERKKGIYLGHYQLLGVTSWLVATKQLEVDVPTVHVCLTLCRNLYSKAQLLSLERHLLDILEFDLNVPTAHTFLDYYIISGHHAAESFFFEYETERHCQAGGYIPFLRRILCVSRWLLDFGLADYEFCQYLPSVAALGAIRLASRLQSCQQRSEIVQGNEASRERADLFLE